MRWTRRAEVDVDLTQRGPDRYRGLTLQHVSAGQDLLNAVKHQIPSILKPVADGVRLRTGSRFHGEALDVAAMMGSSWRDVVLANISYDLAISQIGCSTIALPSPSGPVVARNMDWIPEDLLARASVLLRYSKDGKRVFTNAGFPASIGAVTGMSERGFAVVINAVGSPEGLKKTGYPVLLFLRRVLEDARDFKEALEWVRSETLATSALITLAGTENNERVIVERSPTKAALRWGEPDKALFVTNHYRELYSTPGDESSWCSRYSRICELTEGFDATREITDDLLLYGLSDPAVIQTITAQHILIRPRQREMKLYAPTHLLAA